MQKFIYTNVSNQSTSSDIKPVSPVIAGVKFRIGTQMAFTELEFEGLDDFTKNLLNSLVGMGAFTREEETILVAPVREPVEAPEAKPVDEEPEEETEEKSDDDEDEEESKDDSEEESDEDKSDDESEEDEESSEGDEKESDEESKDDSEEDKKSDDLGEESKSEESEKSGDSEEESGEESSDKSEEDQSDAKDFSELLGGNIKSIQAELAKADEATCSIVLEAEKAGANRASLVKWLEERV